MPMSEVHLKTALFERLKARAEANFDSLNHLAADACRWFVGEAPKGHGGGGAKRFETRPGAPGLAPLTASGRNVLQLDLGPTTRRKLNDRAEKGGWSDNVVRVRAIECYLDHLDGIA